MTQSISGASLGNQNQRIDMIRQNVRSIEKDLSSFKIDQKLDQAIRKTLGSLDSFLATPNPSLVKTLSMTDQMMALINTAHEIDPEFVESIIEELQDHKKLKKNQVQQAIVGSLMVRNSPTGTGSTSGSSSLTGIQGVSASAQSQMLSRAAASNLPDYPTPEEVETIAQEGNLGDITALNIQMAHYGSGATPGAGAGLDITEEEIEKLAQEGNLGDLTALSVQLSTPTNAFNSVSSEEWESIAQKGSLGEITALWMMSSQGSKVLGTPFDHLIPNSQDDMIARLEDLLANGIEDMGELAKIIAILGELGLEIPKELMLKIEDAIAEFIVEKASQASTLFEFLAILSVIQGMVEHVVQGDIIDENKLATTLQALTQTQGESEDASDAAESFGIQLDVANTNPEDTQNDLQRSTQITQADQNLLNQIDQEDRIQHAMKIGQSLTGVIEQRQLDFSIASIRLIEKIMEKELDSALGELNIG